MKSNITAHAAISIAATPMTVWRGLTDAAIIKKYFFGTNAESDWKEGSAVKFSGEYEGKTYEDKGTVLKSIPGELLSYSYWSSMSGIEDKPENYVTVTFEIIQGEETTVNLTQENIPDEKMKEHSESNWKMVLSNMKKVVEELQISEA